MPKQYAPDDHRAYATAFARTMLATADRDEAAFLAALQDLVAAGLSLSGLIVLTQQALVHNLDSHGSDWREEMRAGLLEVAADA